MLKELVFASILAIYQFSGIYCLDKCEKSSKFDEDALSKLSLWPEERDIPWLEGEHYITVGQGAIIQCEVPELPEHSLVAVTFTTAYVDNMRSAVVKRREKKEEMQYDISADVCTIAILDADLKEQAVPDGVPAMCGAGRFISSIEDYNQSSIVTTQLTDESNRRNLLGYYVEKKRY